MSETTTTAGPESKTDDEFAIELLNHLGYEIGADQLAWTIVDRRMVDRAHDVAFSEQRIVAHGRAVIDRVNRTAERVADARRRPTRMSVSGLGELQATATMYDAYCADAAARRDCLVEYIRIVNHALGRGETKSQGF